MCQIDPKGEVMGFLVNPSPPKYVRLIPFGKWPWYFFKMFWSRGVAFSRFNQSIFGPNSMYSKVVVAFVPWFWGWNWLAFSVHRKTLTTGSSAMAAASSTDEPFDGNLVDLRCLFLSLETNMTPRLSHLTGKLLSSNLNMVLRCYDCYCVFLGVMIWQIWLGTASWICSRHTEFCESILTLALTVQHMFDWHNRYCSCMYTVVLFIRSNLISYQASLYIFFVRTRKCSLGCERLLNYHGQ